MSGINIYVILRCCGSGRNRKGNEKHTINLVIELNEKIIKNRKNSEKIDGSRTIVIVAGTLSIS